MSYNGCTKKFDVDQYVAKFCGQQGQGGNAKSWKFKDRKGGAGNLGSGNGRQPVKVFVPSKNSRKDWNY